MIEYEYYTWTILYLDEMADEKYLKDDNDEKDEEDEKTKRTKWFRKASG